jgi:hypothetical protein
MPTLLLKEAFLRAANTAGGGGDDGLHDYLVGVAKTHPQVFVPALSKIIPFQVDVNAAKITVEVIRSLRAVAVDDRSTRSRTAMR